MTNKQPEILSFHQVRERCEQGSVDAWRSFLNFYSPLCSHLLTIYSSGESPVWERTLGALTQDDFHSLKAMQRQSEREFLMDLRATLFDCALAEAEKGQTGESQPLPALHLERAAKVVEGLPLLHQEILWFKMAGYTEATIERILRMAPSVAHGTLDRLDPDLSAVRELTTDHCVWPTAWLTVLQQARAAKKDDCPPLHQLMRIHDGQVTWYDKEPVERKVAGCLHCLDSWTGLREVAYWRRAAPAVSPEEIEKQLQRLPVAGQQKKESFLGRLFKK